MLSDAVLYGVRTFLDPDNAGPRSPNRPEAVLSYTQGKGTSTAAGEIQIRFLTTVRTDILKAFPVRVPAASVAQRGRVSEQTGRFRVVRLIRELRVESVCFSRHAAASVFPGLLELASFENRQFIVEFFSKRH